MDINAITEKMEASFKKLIQQLHVTFEKRYLLKTPVATMVALAAITTPVIGERRQVLSFPDRVIIYTFSTSAAGVAAGDGTTGTWITEDLDIDAGETWEGDTTYPAGTPFNFETSVVDAVDANGNPIPVDTFLTAYYVDGNSDPIETTSADTAAPDLAELAKFEVSAGADSPMDRTIPQSYTDGIFLTN